jgi:hypothetical protein
MRLCYSGSASRWRFSWRTGGVSHEIHTLGNRPHLPIAATSGDSLFARDALHGLQLDYGKPQRPLRQVPRAWRLVAATGRRARWQGAYPMSRILFRILLLLALGLLLAILADAQDSQLVEVKRSPLPVRILRHVSLETVADALVIGAEGADAGSSIHCKYPHCIETNPILGKDPSPAAAVAYSAVIAGGIVMLNHLITHKLDPEYRTLVLVDAVPISISEFITVRSNVAIASARRASGIMRR